MRDLYGDVLSVSMVIHITCILISVVVTHTYICDKNNTELYTHCTKDQFSYLGFVQCSHRM